MRRPIALLLSAALALSSLSVLAQTAPQLAGLSASSYVLSANAGGTTYILKNGKTGAVTTGTDPGALLQAAIDAATTAESVTILVGPGDYALTAGLTIGPPATASTNYQVTIRGAGRQSTRFTYAGTGAAITIGTGSIPQTSNTRLEGFSLEQIGTPRTGKGINLNGSRETILRDLSIGTLYADLSPATGSNPERGFEYGVYEGTIGDWTTIDSCEFYGNLHAVQFVDQANNSQIRNSQFINCFYCAAGADGILVSNSANVTIDGNRFHFYGKDTSGYGSTSAFAIKAQAAIPNLNVTNNYFEANAVNLWLNDTGNISGVRFEGNYVNLDPAQLPTPVYGIYAGLGSVTYSVDGVVIKGNNFNNVGSGDRGIYFNTDVKNWDISENSFTNLSGIDFLLQGTNANAGLYQTDSQLTLKAPSDVWLDKDTDLVFEGATADAYEVVIRPTDPTADRTITLPDATGTVLISSLATNAIDVANSVWAASNALVFEDAQADASEGSLVSADITNDRTWTLPDATGTILLNTDAAGGAVATARMHASLYGDPNYYTKPAFYDLWGEFWRGQPMRFDADNGNSNYEDPVFSISQCPANSPSSGSCTSTTGIDYVCISAIDTDSDSTNELAVGDPVIFIGSAASSAVATPTGQVYYVFTIGNGAGSGTDCPSGTNNKITLRPRPNYVTEGINATGSKMTTLWHHPYHPGYAGSDLMGYKVAYAPRSVYGAQGRNLLANGSLHFNATTPTGWTVSSFTPVGAQFQATPTVATTYQCYEGEAGTAPYSCIAGPNPCTSGGYIRQGPITVEPGVQYVVGGYITTYSTDILGVYVDVNGDSTLEALESTTFAFDATLFNTFWGLPRLYWRTVTIPATANQAWVQYTHGASCQANIPSLDNFFFRRLTTRVGDDVLGSVGTYLIGDPGTRKIVVAGDSWIYDDGTDYSNGNKFCDGLRAGMAARLGRNIDSQIICEGRSGETTNDLLTGTTCTDSTPTGGAYNCWDRQVARHDPLYLVVNLGTNDVRTSVTAATYVANMLEIGTRAQSIGAIPIVLSPSPIINDIADYTHYVTAHSYYTLLKHAVLDDVP